MQIDWSFFLSGASIGAIVGFIAKTVIEMINKHFDRKHELGSLAFNKQLQAAEDCVAFNFSYSFYLQQTKICTLLLANIVKNQSSEEYDLLSITNMLTQNGVELQKLMQEKFFSANVIYTYFNVSQESGWNDTDINEVIKLTAQMTAYTNNMNYYSLKLNEAYNADIEEEEKYYSDKIDEVLNILVPIYERTSQLMDKNQKTLTQQIQAIRKELNDKY